MAKLTYAQTWGTPIGQDCINLDSALCLWLGERLYFLGTHTSSYSDTYNSLEDWRAELCANAAALKLYAVDDSGNRANNYAAARKALIWVAMNLPALWD